MRYDSGELKLIKSLFDKNDALIMALRKFFLKGTLTTEESNLVTGFASSSTNVTLLKKTILPEIDPSAPLFQCVDFFVGVATKGRATSDVIIEVGIKDGMKSYFEAMFNTLVGTKNNKEIILNDYLSFRGKSDEQIHVALGTRNSIIAHLDFQLKQLIILAAMKEETPEEVATRRGKDSTK